MACVLAEGRSVIDNAAREPEVEDLANSSSPWARASKPGTSRLTIDGVAELRPAVTRRDRPLVSATYLASDSSRRRGARGRRPSEHMEMLLRKIEAMAAWSTYAVRASPHRAANFPGL